VGERLVRGLDAHEVPGEAAHEGVAHVGDLRGDDVVERVVEVDGVVRLEPEGGEVGAQGGCVEPSTLIAKK
jgi:hypothetical protein